jgi:hypothetical protein
MMDENDWGKFESGGDELVVHWTWVVSAVLQNGTQDASLAELSMRQARD